MGNCLPSLSQESKRHKSRSRSHGDVLEEEVAPAPSRKDERKRSVRFVDQGDGKKDRVRVKVVMTKKEAVLLLSKLASRRESRVEDMLCELKRARGCSLSSTVPVSGKDCWRPTLETIPEI
ncbi:unnamed protein product [Musa hybrid cultivar]